MKTGAASALHPRDLFDASPNPYLVLDRTLNIVGANKAYLAQTKRQLSDIVGRWAWDAFPTDPDTLRESVASFERVIRTGQPDTMALLRFDIPRPESEGGGFEERYWSISHTPVLNAAGEVELVLQHPVDVTELQRLREVVNNAAEEARPLRLAPAQSAIFSRAESVHAANRSLRAESEEFRRLFQQAPGFMAVLRGPDHVFELTNSAYLQLVGHRDLIGKGVREALPELAGQGFFRLLDGVYASAEPFVGRRLPIRIERSPGAELEMRFVDFVYQPVVGPAGEVTGIFVQGNDVTDAHRMEEALRQLNETLEARVEERTGELLRAEEALRQSQKLEAIGQLTGGVAHDFNNLLTVIRGSVELLMRPNLTEERRRRYIHAIADTADRATKLTSQLLAFARRQALRPEVFDVGQAVQALRGILETLCGPKVQVDVWAPSEPGFVHADPSQFDTAMVNLAANARDAMDGEGRLSIRVDAVKALPAASSRPEIQGDFIAVMVVDTGSGIPADKLDQIFEPFFTTKGVGRGTGLGLSQVYGFTKQSGGDVQVQSELGRGASFTLYLPAVAAPSARPEPPPAAEPLVDGQGACILVVEDNAEVGEFSTHTLKELGFNSVRAHNGAAALAELEKDASRFDAVFSDVLMPGMSGIELGREIRRLYPELPVVLTSGYSHGLAENGAEGFELLHKPYSVEALSRVLRTAAKRRRSERFERP